METQDRNLRYHRKTRPTTADGFEDIDGSWFDARLYISGNRAPGTTSTGDGASVNHGRVKAQTKSGYSRNEFQTRHATKPLDALWDGGWVPLDPEDRPDDDERVSWTPGGMKHYVDKPRTHGSSYSYVRLKCRCQACRNWKRDYDRKRRAKHS